MSIVTLKNRYFPFVAAFLRIAIGWHFLYEGLTKIFNPAWSARPFLEGSRWIFGDFFRWLASGETAMKIIDYANEYGLALIGLALIIGLFTRYASLSGALLLLMYYLAYPPFAGYAFATVSEGNYLIVNKNLIELIALIVLVVTGSGKYFGLDSLRDRKPIVKSPEELNSINTVAISDRNRRREFIKSLAGFPVLAGFAGAYLGENNGKTDAVSGATIKLDFKQIKDLKGEMPAGKLGEFNISRLIMGCNLISGYAHARDLRYANNLFKAYNTDQKVIETYRLAELAGINATFMVNRNFPIFHRYQKMYGSKMQTIVQTYIKEDNFLGDIDLAIENGGTTLYIQGAESDRYVREGKTDLLGKAVDYIKSKGYLAGVGAHSLEVIKACEASGINADYYVKTFHHDKYWSAHPMANRTEFSVDTKKFLDHNLPHDNMFELFPEKTIDYMKKVNKPWIAFKVLAAGAILPSDGFRYAFENGADFICVGMFDFQVVENSNTLVEILGSLKNRERRWYS
ncbi:MAG: DoxX family protein [Bacteroidales bacterium]